MYVIANMRRRKIPRTKRMRLKNIPLPPSDHFPHSSRREVFTRVEIGIILLTSSRRQVSLSEESKNPLPRN